jgi:hypothetical protein
MDNIRFNKCQTPIEELSVIVDDKTIKFKDSPQEVQEQFWDYLNNVPFIRWMVSAERPRISELPRDEYGRAIIDVTKPPILEGSDYFRQTAIEWQKNGKYTHLKPNANPNSEFGRWIREERKRGWDGFVNPDTGMWVTGDYYWMLNYCPMHLVEKRDDGLEMRTTAHPKIWDGQFLSSHYILQARQKKHHAAYLASRGKGKTTLGGAMLAKRFILGEFDNNRTDIQCLVTAADKTKLIGVNQILSVFIDNIDFCAKQTQFAARRLKSSVQELTWQMGYKKSGSDVAYGSKNSVQGIISGVNQDKLNGSRGVLYIIEEAGIFKDLLDLYNLIRPSVEQGSSVFGEILLYGTAGNEQSDFTAFAEMFYSPTGYNIYGLDNVFDKEGQGRKKSSFFYPVYMNYDDSCIDENGNSDITKALFMICMDRYKVKYGSTDINAITKRISQYPITPQEAIIRSRGNMFPVTELNARLNELDNNPNSFDDVYVGDLVFKDEKVEFVPTGDIPIREFPTKDNKVKGSIEIFCMPQKLPDGTIPRGRYIAGADPYDNDVADSMSLGSIIMLDTWTDTIVMEYTGRPDYADDYYEICRKACLFYNATLLYEQNKKGLFPYFSQKNSLHLLADTPEYLLGKQLIKGIGYGNTRKGVTTTAPIKEHGFGLIRDWLLKPVTKVVINAEGEEEEITMSNLYNIKNRALLKELILYHPQLNVDRIMALCMLMIYRQEKMVVLQGDLRKVTYKPTGIEADSYWDKNYPGKKSW